MTSFADISLHEINFDCRFYSGYKPCHKHDGCPDCPHYEKRGEQILIIKLGAMGDVLRTKSILPALKKKHPQSWIVWLTNPGSESLVRDPLVDEIRIFNSEGLGALSGREFEKIICLDKDAHAISLSAQLKGKIKQGFAPTHFNTVSVWNEATVYALRLGLSDPLKYHENRKTVPEILHEMIELPYSGEDYSIMVSDKARDAAAIKWRTLDIPRGKKIIGLNTGCGPVFATKGWTPENMEKFLQLCGEDDSLAVVLLGGVREKPLHERLMATAQGHVFDAGTDNSLETFFGIVDHCDVIATADSLAMHVAIALKKPVVVWFGPTCEQEVDLFGRGEKIVTNFACSPCYLKECPQDVFCLEAMSASQVFNSVRRVLENSGRVVPSAQAN